MPLTTENSVVKTRVSETTSKSAANIRLRRIDIIFTFHGPVHGVLLFRSYVLILACRTLVVRELKGLQDIISRTVVHYHMGDKGWKFVQSEDELEGSQPDPLYHAKFLRELYFKAQPDYEGRFTVPVLWDKKTETIVNNESRYSLLVST
jgi:glutathionyl-hydroquinone reductase